MARSVALTVTCMLLLSCSRQEAGRSPDTDSSSVPSVGRKQDRTETSASVPVADRLNNSRADSRPSRPSIQKLSKVDLPKLVQSVKASVVRIDVITPSAHIIGSGFVAYRRNVVITNYHVVKNARRATVTFSDKTTFPVEGSFLLLPSSDIAILKLSKPAGGKALPLADKSPQLGETVIAIGMPEGLSFSISSGIVSAVRTSAELKRQFRGTNFPGSKLVQTTAQISHGNSGGPLINSKGEVVGMNTFTFVKGQNLNFAISSQDILAAVRRGIAKSPSALTPSRPNDPANKPAVGRLKPPATLTVTPAEKLNQLVMHKIDQQRKDWPQKVKELLKKQRAEIEKIETLIKQEMRTMSYVQRGGGDTKKILETLTRHLWFSRAKGRLAYYRRILAELTDQRKSVEVSLSQNLYPIPPISNGRAVGDFGVLRNATVLRVLGKKEFLVVSSGKTLYCRNFESEDSQVGRKLAGPFLVVIAGTYQHLDLSGVKSVFVLQPASTPDLRADYDRLLAFQKAEEARVAAKRDRRIRENRDAIAKKKRFPILATAYEPKDLILILYGRIKPAPPKSVRQYTTIVTSHTEAYVEFFGVLSITKTRRTETGASRMRRRRQKVVYNTVTKKQFLGYAVNVFIQDMRDKIAEGRWRDDDGKLASAVNQLATTTFGRSDGYDWRTTNIAIHKLQIIDQITKIAIDYGWMPKTGKPPKRASGK